MTHIGFIKQVEPTYAESAEDYSTNPTTEEQDITHNEILALNLFTAMATAVCIQVCTYTLISGVYRFLVWLGAH